MLRLPNFSKSFVVRTDGSLVAIGATLAQLYDGIECLVAYFSQNLTLNDQRYDVGDREMLGFVCS